MDQLNLIGRYYDAGVELLLLSTSFLGTRMNSYYTIKEIEQVVSEGVLPVMVVINRFFFDEDLKQLEHDLIALHAIGVQRIMFSDFAVFELIEQLQLDFYTVCSTDTTITSSNDVNTCLSYGISEVVLARELTINEILVIADKSDGRIGLNAFGFPMMSISRKKHLKHYLDFIGRPVPDTYPIRIQEKNRNESYLLFENSAGNTLLNGKIATVLADTELLEPSRISWYFDTLGLDAEMVLQVVASVKRGEPYARQEDICLAYGQTLSRGLLDTPTNMGKDGRL